MKKKFISYLLIFLLSLGFVFQFAKADSGWDVDYDSGSSWDSGSDWDSGSSWDSGSDWDSNWDSSSDWGSGSSWSSGSSGGYNGESNNHSNSTRIYDLLLYGSYFIAILTVGITSIFISASRKKHIHYNPVTSYQEMSEEEILAIDPDMNIEEFKHDVYDTFVQVQNAWTNFDFDTLHSLLTDEIYNMYESQLQILKTKKQKNIMDNFSLDDIKIINMFKKEDTISVQVYLQVRFYDYVIEEETNKVVRGDKSRRVIVTYVLTFVKGVEDKVRKCPNCGAEIEENTDTCLYCHTKFEKLSTKYILSKKTNLSQSKE